MTEMIMTVANAERIAADVLAEVLAPPPKVDYLQWAVDNVEFTRRESNFVGKYNRDLFGYFDEVLRALGPDDPCRIVTLMGSAQIGKTVVGNVFCGGTMDMDPCDFMFIHPTEENASRWSKMKLMPFIKGTPSLKSIFPLQSREGGNSVLYKERGDGRGAILISGSTSEAATSMVSIEKQVQDDLSKWDGDEGQADSRSSSREFAKILKSSTPLVHPGCKITRNYEAGSQERFFVPCPHCGAMQTLEWENMLAGLDRDQPEAAHFTCVECGCEINEHHRAGMRRGGDWRAENPKAKRFHRSFSIWSAYSDLQSWERIARAWIAAEGDPKAERTFYNDVVGRAYRTLGDAPPWEALRDRAIQSERARGTVPARHVLLTCGVDCQKDRVEYQVVAWARDHRSAVVEYGIIPGHISSLECQAMLNGLMLQTYVNTYGRRLNIDLTAIDGNAWTEDVWEWAKRHPSSKVIMVRGVGSEAAPLLVQVKRETNRQGKKLPYHKRFFNFATSVLKMALYRNLVKTDPVERGFVDLPKGLEDEYFRMLTAESRKRVTNKKTGFDEYKWVKDPLQANEGLDTYLQAQAAFMRIAGPTRVLPDAVWDRFEAERDRAPEPVQGDIEDLFNHQPAPAPTSAPVPSAPTSTKARPKRGVRKMRRD